MTTTTQAEFHPMRGHVFDGATVLCDNGDVLTIKAIMPGWQLVDQNGNQLWMPSHSAMAVEHCIARHGREK